MTERHTVHDHGRELVFSGVLLGYATSESVNKRRWTEMSIFRTDAGQYIVSGVGTSLVKKGEWIVDRFTNEKVQSPEDEIPRAWTHLCENAEGVIVALHLRDHDGIRYMTNVARAALESAILHDDALRKASLVEEIA
jgi:hypothetical protein